MSACVDGDVYSESAYLRAPMASSPSGICLLGFWFSKPLKKSNKTSETRNLLQHVAVTPSPMRAFLFSIVLQRGEKNGTKYETREETRRK